MPVCSIQAVQPGLVFLLLRAGADPTVKYGEHRGFSKGCTLTDILAFVNEQSYVRPHVSRAMMDETSWLLEQATQLVTAGKELGMWSCDNHCLLPSGLRSRIVAFMISSQVRTGIHMWMMELICCSLYAGSYPM